MTTIVGHLSSDELEARYEGAADPVAKSHFHALWLLSCHPDAATEEDRAALKKSSRPRLTRSDVNIRTQASKSGRWMNTALA